MLNLYPPGDLTMTPFETLAVIAFWGCAALVGYTWLGYPLIVWCCASLFGRRNRAPEVSEEELPTVSLLIAAHNEEAVIEERIRNALASDYPAARYEIVVASDGSSDATGAIVRRYADRGVRLLEFDQQRGKAAVLNAAVPELTGEVILFSDANTFLDPTAMRRLVLWFRCPAVGVVCGRVVLTDPEQGRNVDGLYWKFETFLRRCEGRLSALPGANGAIYAVRRELYVLTPNGTLVDDLVIPLLARLHSDCAIVAEESAVAREETPPDIASEFRRRSRIGRGGFQSMAVLWGLLAPQQGWLAFTFLSHKLLRWLCPFFLVGLLAASACLADQSVFQCALVAQLGFYFVSFLTAFVPLPFHCLKPLRLAAMFTGMNVALFIGFCHWMHGSGNGTWKPTVRVVEASEVLR